MNALSVLKDILIDECEIKWLWSWETKSYGLGFDAVDLSDMPAARWGLSIDVLVGHLLFVWGK